MLLDWWLHKLGVCENLFLFKEMINHLAISYSSASSFQTIIQFIVAVFF